MLLCHNWTATKQYGLYFISGNADVFVPKGPLVDMECDATVRLDRGQLREITGDNTWTQ